MQSIFMQYVRVPILVIWSVLLTSFTIILGAVPLRALRLTVGNNYFWIIGVALIYGFSAFGLLPIAIILGTQIILVGAFSELEDRGFGLKQSTWFAVFLTSTSLFSCFYIWTSLVGKGWYNLVLSNVSSVMEKAAITEVFRNIQPQDIVAQLPSITLVLMIVSLALALVFERIISKWAGIKIMRAEKLSSFSAPDSAIWFFIFSLLGAFGQFSIKPLEIISINILNVSAAIYFLQGAAIMAAYFVAFKIGSFWRTIWIFLLVFQLPIFLSLIGVLDYWLDIRRVFTKKATQIKGKKVKE